MKTTRCTGWLVVALGLLLLFAADTVQASEPESIIFLVRHGETVPSDPNTQPYDPPLNEEGEARARELARVLGDVQVTGVFSTNWRRTLATAAPVAEQKGLEVQIYDPGSEEIVERLRRQAGTFVVLGHSDTTPDLVKRLGGEPGEPIRHMEHDRLYVVVFQRGSSTPATLLLRYGQLSSVESR